MSLPSTDISLEPLNNAKVSHDHFAQIQSTLRKSLSDSHFHSWIAPLAFVSDQVGTLTLSAPTRFVRDWVKSHYEDKIIRLLMQQGFTQRKIEWMIDKKTTSSQTNTLIPVANENTGTVATPHRTEDLLSSPLDVRLTFEHFVVADSNKLAFSAAEHLTKSLEHINGPLFITGAVGQGKSHLLQATAHALRELYPQKKIVYMSAEKFMYGFVRALQKRETIAFKDFFRTIDVLLIDDIQFICGKESTQQEFFHTFNALSDLGKKIVLSSDRPPSQLHGIDEKLKSRFSMGLVAQILPADADLRLKILQQKCKFLKKHVPVTVLEFLAQNISNSPREAEGALHRLIAQSDFLGHQITLTLAETHLQDALQNSHKVMTVEDIQNAVTSYFRLKMSDFLSSKRDRNLARPRQIAMYLAKNLTTLSLPEIGRRFGGRDHTTILHGVRKIESLLGTDHHIASEIAAIKRTLA